MNSESADELNCKPVPDQPAVATSAGAGAGRYRPTAVGYSDGSSGGSNGGCGPGCPGFGASSSVPHQKLKDLAISALDQSQVKNYTTVQSILARELMSQQTGAADDTASVLSSLVVTAYSIAATAPCGDAMPLLSSAFPNFTHEQLHRIAGIAN